MIAALKTVFFRPQYLLLAIGISIMLFLMVTWLPNRSLLLFSLSSDVVPFWGLIAQSYGFFLANETPARAIVDSMVIALSGINIALLWYYVAHRIAMDRRIGVGVVGTMVGLLGVGCAACGSVILTSVFGIGLAGSFLGFLPFGGIEFGVLGLCALGFSISILAKRIEHPLVCAL
ncbi:hypothetical protein BK004_01835 [bacterium CG10_46_32]|nr:MAG: hypothetical protein BK004_01835 [bacterium CG10_46_32]PIR56176.1 MAG: hypothetical protein COU73_01865 [Parcubacteria group bacterium CG10_big_fil_rev_8_21_14_0_10_46_32]